MPKNNRALSSQHAKTVISTSHRQGLLVEMGILREALSSTDHLQHLVKRNSLVLIGLEFAVAPLTDYVFAAFWSTCHIDNSPLSFFFNSTTQDKAHIIKGSILFFTTLLVITFSVRTLLHKLFPHKQDTLEELTYRYTEKNDAELKNELEILHRRYLSSIIHITGLVLFTLLSWQVLFGNAFKNNYSVCQNDIRNTLFILITLALIIEAFFAANHLYKFAPKTASSNFRQIKTPKSFQLQWRTTEEKIKNIHLYICSVEEEYFFLLQKALEKTGVLFYEDNLISQFFIPAIALSNEKIKELNKNIEIIYNKFLKNKQKIECYLSCYNKMIELAFDGKKKWQVINTFNTSYLPKIKLTIKTNVYFPQTRHFLIKKLSTLFPTDHFTIEGNQIFILKIRHISLVEVDCIRQALYETFEKEKKTNAELANKIHHTFFIPNNYLNSIQTNESYINPGKRWRFRFPKKILSRFFFSEFISKPTRPTWFEGVLSVDDERITEVLNTLDRSKHYLFFDFNLINDGKKISDESCKKFSHVFAMPHFGYHGNCIKRITGSNQRLSHQVNGKTHWVTLHHEIKIFGSPNRIFCYQRPADNTKDAFLLVAALFSESGLHAGHTITNTVIQPWQFNTLASPP